jgi:hypothetical protein
MVMDIDRWTSVVARTFFFGAFLLLAVAVLVKLLNAFGALALGVTVTPARLLEWAVILLIFVIALLLRQIREELRTGSALRAIRVRQEEA